MATIGSLVINVIGNTVQLEKDVKRSQGIVGQLDNALGTMGLGTITAGAAIAGFTKFMGDAVAMAREAEEAEAELNAVLTSTKGAAGLTSEELINMADNFERLTQFEAEATMGAQSILLTFTSIGRDVFPQATETVLNMATMFGGADQAAIQLGKALNDPIVGVSSLRRVGVMLTEQQEEQIKKFVEQGDIVSAQKVILSELETEFGGLAVAMGQTTTGQAIILNNTLGSMQEAIGAGVLPVLNDLIGSVSNLAFSAAGTNDQLTLMTQYAAELATTPLGAVIDNMNTSMALLNSLSGFANDILEKLGLNVKEDSQSFSILNSIVGTVGHAIQVLAGGPVAWLNEGLNAIKNTIEIIRSLNPAQIFADLQNIGNMTGLGNVLGFAEGGMIPGPLGAPRLAVVHGGEMVLNPQQQQSMSQSVTISGGINFYGTSAPATRQEADKSADMFLSALRAKGVAI